MGHDGTVGANKAAIKTIADNTDLNVQGYFIYDAHKGDGLTNSHLRFGKSPIRAQHEIKLNADYIAIHHRSYLKKFSEKLVRPLKKGGVFVINCEW